MTGWGKVGDDEPAATVLRKARVPIVSDKQCIENVSSVDECKLSIDWCVFR